MGNLLQDSFFVFLLSALSGMIFGSFATALIYRLPRDIDWIKQRSKCTNCNTDLGILDLIPIFSYILNVGKCRHCGKKYGAKYLFIEILMTICFVMITNHFGATIESVFICLLAFAVIVLSVIDFEHYIIPDEVNIFILLLGLIYQAYLGPEIENIIIMPLIFVSLALFLRWLMFAWKKKEGLGLGDVKFFLAAGMWLSVEQLPMFLLFSGLAGIIIAIFWKILNKGQLFPFGPALSASLFFCVAFPTLTVELLHKFHSIIYQ